MLKSRRKANSHYSQILWDAFAERRAKNASYSLRAFARQLDISPAALSQVLSRKRDLSKRNALKVADRLALSPSQTSQLLSQIRGQQADGVDVEERQLLQEDTFKLMSDWYYIAILNLAKLADNRSDPAWVASRLDISLPEAKNALIRLERLGFIEVREGKLVRTAVSLTTTNGVASSAIRTYHKQNLKRAEASIDRDLVDLRDLSALTMAVHPDEIPAAKEAIQKFKNEFTKLFGSKDPTEVYTLAIQLFPVTVQGDSK